MATKGRHFRMSDESWARIQATAARRGENVSEQIRALLEDYADENLPGYTAGFAAGVATGKREAERDLLKGAVGKILG